MPYSHSKNQPLKVRVLAAWWQAETVKGAAELLGISEQTAKNELLWFRRECRATNNDDLLRQVYREVALCRDIGPRVRMRTLRYHYDYAYRERTKKTSRAIMRKKRSLEVTERNQAFARLIAEQKGRCAICGKGEEWYRTHEGEPVKLAVDHDHATGAIRQLLCSSCNLMLGCAKDAPETLEAGADYLRRHAQATSHNEELEAA